jgi:hypothetical protein
MPIRTKTASPVSPVRLASWSVVADQSITLLGASRDRTKFYGATSGNQGQNNVLKQSVNGGATWTTVATLSDADAATGQSEYATILGFVELPNGEILLGTSAFSQPAYVLKSSGWAANPTTATFSKKLSMLGPLVNDYSLTNHCVGSNGVVLAAEGGPQTSASGDQTNKARRLWLSQDFGETWRSIFDIYSSYFLPFVGGSGLHLHGCCYDESWDRIWLLFGDNTGDGAKVSGYPGGAQIFYSDNRGATWSLYPGMGTMEAQGLVAQWTAVRATPKGVLLLSDAMYNAGVLVLPKTGYRTLGPEQFGPVQFGRGVGRALRSNIAEGSPIFAGYSNSVATDHYLSVSPDGSGMSWYEFWRETDLTARPSIGGGVHTVLGPDAAGRIVATYEGYGLLTGTLA